MEYKITKTQYDYLVNKLLRTYLGDIYYEEDENYYELITKRNNENFADIWRRKSKCKKELVLHYDISAILTRFVPVIKKKRFGKLLIKYVYEQTGLLADCIDYDYDFILKKNMVSDDEDDVNQDEFSYEHKTFEKKIKLKKNKLK